MPRSTPPQPNVLFQVRAAFTARGTSLHQWCLDNNLEWSMVRRALTGERTSALSLRLRKRALKASGATTSQVVA